MNKAGAPDISAEALEDLRPQRPALPSYTAAEQPGFRPPARLLALATRYQQRLAEDPSVTVPARMEDFRRAMAAGLAVYLPQESAVLNDNDREQLLDIMVDLAFGLGPIDGLMHDPNVTEIMVDGPRRVLVEVDGRIHRTPERFNDEEHLVNVVRRMAAGFARRIDATNPMVDGVLTDGSRMNAILYPVSKSGTALTIRKFKTTIHDMTDLVAEGTLTVPMARFLAAAVRGRLNLLVSGGTASGKTTTLNVLASFIPPEERVITIEDVGELRLEHPYVVSLEYRPPNVEGLGELTIRRLLRNSLRMRPDRIIVGEVRGAEAIDMLQAMNTGHDGSMSTIHANSTFDAFSRLETMVVAAGENMPLMAVQTQVAAAIQLVVQQARFADGSRRIIQVSEMLGYEDGRPVLRDIYGFRRTPDGASFFETTGYRPASLALLAERGVRVPDELFEQRTSPAPRANPLPVREAATPAKPVLESGGHLLDRARRRRAAARA